MEAIVFLEKILCQYDEDKTIRKNGTVLLHPDRIPKAKHMFFPGLSNEIIQEYLVANYQHTIPGQFIKLLQFSNGANLFMFRFVAKKCTFAGSGLTLYGLPRTPPFNRPQDQEEPFDVRVEDLRRHQNIPDTWLSVGRYQYFANDIPSVLTTIFIDCFTQETIAVEIDTDRIVEKWDSLDNALCQMINSLTDIKEEYPFRK